jgi:hypothetical protein
MGNYVRPSFSGFLRIVPGAATKDGTSPTLREVCLADLGPRGEMRGGFPIAF